MDIRSSRSAERLAEHSQLFLAYMLVIRYLFKIRLGVTLRNEISQEPLSMLRTMISTALKYMDLAEFPYKIVVFFVGLTHHHLLQKTRIHYLFPGRLNPPVPASITPADNHVKPSDESVTTLTTTLGSDHTIDVPRQDPTRSDHPRRAVRPPSQYVPDTEKWT